MAEDSDTTAEKEQESEDEEDEDKYDAAMVREEEKQE